MKREDQKREKELKKNLDALLKEFPKLYKKQQLKKKDYLLWLKRNDMIYSIFPFVNIRECDLVPVLQVRIGYKPLWIDDLLWDILGMETNKNEPDSLRVVGAFTAAEVYEKELIELESEDIEYLRTVLQDKIDAILVKLDTLDEMLYIENLTEATMGGLEDRALIAIHQGKDEKSVTELINMWNGSGRYKIGDKTYKELIKEYEAIIDDSKGNTN